MSVDDYARATPVRTPDTSSRSVMTKRAWMLVVLNVLIPGSAQTLAGSRRLGRFGLATTLVLWALVLVAVAVWLLAPRAVYSVLTVSPLLLVVQLLLAFYALAWLVFTLDTLRLAHLVKTFPGVRGVIAGFTVLLLVSTAGTSAYGAYLAGVARGALDGIFSSGQAYVPPVNGRYNVLMLGGDAGSDRVGLRPDSLSVVSVDAQTGASTVIGIPRNMQRAPFVAGSPLWKAFPTGYDCGVNCLIEFLYTYGEQHPELYPDAVAHGSTPAIEAVKDGVEGVLGITIQYYVLVDMKGFSDLIDALGGVTIDVTQKLPINGGQAADGTPINVQGWIMPGVQRMNGFTALWYARSRHTTNDYDRMARQRQVQEAVLKQFSPEVVLTKFQAIASAGKQVMQTDIPQVMLGLFVDLAGKARKQTLTKLELVPPAVDEVHPDFTEIKSLVAAAITTSTPTPSPGG